MTNIKTTQYKRFNIEYWIDEDPISPREWDNIGKIACFHRRYDLGDKHHFNDSQDLIDFIQDNQSELVYLPIFAYEHSGITIRTASYECQWDSGQIGFIYAYKKNMIEQGFKSEAEMLTCLKQEIKTYDDYIVGNVYGYTITDEEGEMLDSCGGFVGDFSYVETEAELTADYYDNKLPKQLDIAFCFA
jgi:hypothetical protein